MNPTPRRLATFAVLVVALGWATVARSQPAPVEPPVVGRPPQYSGMVGRFTIEATAAPTAIPVEQPITLRVRIRGRAASPNTPQRKRLRLFPEDFAERFYVEPVPAEDRTDETAGVWEFVYRLRPRSVRVLAIDDLTLVYFDPDVKKYQTRVAPEQPIEVTPPPPADAATLVMPGSTLPAALTELAPPDAVIATAHRSPVAVGTLIVGLATAPLVFWWIGRRFGHRSIPPTGAAGPRAIADLARRPAWLVVPTYLRDRLGYPAAEPTPTGLADFLARRGFAKAVCEQARAVIAACDAIRYAPAARVDPPALRDAAARLIEALEADPCVR